MKNGSKCGKWTTVRKLVPSVKNATQYEKGSQGEKWIIV